MVCKSGFLLSLIKFGKSLNPDITTFTPIVKRKKFYFNRRIYYLSLTGLQNVNQFT